MFLCSTTRYLGEPINDISAQAPLAKATRRFGEPMNDLSAQAPTVKGSKTTRCGTPNSHVPPEHSQPTRFSFFSYYPQLEHKVRKYPSPETVMYLTSSDPSTSRSDDDDDEDERPSHPAIIHGNSTPAGHSPELQSPYYHHDPHSRFEQMLAAKQAAENLISGHFVGSPARWRMDDVYLGYTVKVVPVEDESSTLTDCEVGTNQQSQQHFIVPHTLEPAPKVNETPVPVLHHDREEVANKPGFDTKLFLNRYWKCLLAFFVLVLLFVYLVALILWHTSLNNNKDENPPGNESRQDSGTNIWVNP
mmetsp:Transcript_12268/g.23480  ORF Transcript_12268/g.23480 Transcript_12268/m.23480 type:complete len:304 (+) Transcript_12268:208-1119(+)